MYSKYNGMKLCIMYGVSEGAAARIVYYIAQVKKSGAGRGSRTFIFTYMHIKINYRVYVKRTLCVVCRRPMFKLIQYTQRWT